MVLKTNIQAHAINSSVLRKTLEGYLSSSSNNTSLRYLPERFLLELQEFMKRNSIVSISTLDSPSEHCCLRCLKAHALKKASDMNLSSLFVLFISESFDCEEGHDGYYLDGEKLIEI